MYGSLDWLERLVQPGRVPLPLPAVKALQEGLELSPVVWALVVGVASLALVPVGVAALLAVAAAVMPLEAVEAP
jgi:hypothetical protein